jgi:hypothetical protein
VTRVAILGTGTAGVALAAACAKSDRFELVGMHTTSSDRDGIEVRELVPAAPANVPVTRDLDRLLGSDGAEAVVHAAAQPLDSALDVFSRCTSAGKAVVTLTGLVHPVLELGEGRARGLDETAAAGGGRVVGAGLNPGFALDLLPAFLAGLVVSPARVAATRVTDMRHWGDAPLRHQGGVGGEGDPDVAQGLSLMPSATVVAEALSDAGHDLEESVEVLRTSVARTDGRRSVAADEIVGFRRSVRGKAGASEIDLAWIGIFCVDPNLDGVSSGIDVRMGEDDELVCTLRGETFVDPHPATAARALASIRPLLALPPGLHRPDRLPLAAS